MTPVSEAEVRAFVQLLKQNILPFLEPDEIPTFLIRPSVSHGDIEIFINGRMESLDGPHFRKTVEANGVRERVTVQILPRLRGKRFPFSSYKCSYTVEQVQNEINWALSNVLAEIMSEEEKKKFNADSEEKIKDVFGLQRAPEEFDSANLMLINRLMAKKLVELGKKKSKNG